MGASPTERQLLETFSAAIADRYAVDRELGRGGMATVYLARDLTHHRQVALKLLHPELGASIGGDRFLREIEVGTMLQHPNIVGVLDSGEAAGQLYYVMPYVEGKSLRDRLDEQSQLGIEEAIDIIRQVADALDFAHARKVIHRDIKPENILLDGSRALLADFGIARAVTIAGGETLTQTGMTVGTPTYMSPEQALGSKDVTPESDIYSLACVLYHLLAGQPPFSGPTAMALLARHSLDNVPSLKIVRNTIPDAVEDAIVRAMAKVPADRFHSASEFVAALSDHDGAATRRQNSMRAQARARDAATAPAKRRRLMVLAAVAVPVLLGAFWAGRGFLAAETAAEGLAGDFAKSNIAVLYFEDRSPNAELAFVADGITESLIGELGAVEQFKVISRNGVRPYRGSNVTPDSLARALKVGTLVSGTVAQVGDLVRVDMELVDARTGEEIGRTRIEQPRSQLVALQDSLARDLGDFLRRRVGGEVQRLTSRGGTRNSKAWEGMQRATQTIESVDALVAAGNTETASRVLLQADTQLAVVETLDGGWVDPIAQRGWLAYRQARLLRPSDPEQKKWIELGLSHAARALGTSPNDASSLDLRGTLRYWTWLANLAPDPAAASVMFAGAEADFRAATAANRAQATAWNSLSHLLLNKSQISEAKLAADNGYRADPYLTDADRTIFRLFGASLDLNIPTEARKWCDEGARRFPDNFRFAQCKVSLFALETPTPPAVPEIWATYDEFVQKIPPTIREIQSLRGRMFVALGLLRAGLTDSALAVAKSARGNPGIDPTGDLLHLEAIVHAQAGNTDEAIRLLRRYFASNPQRAETGEDESWWFDDIKDDPRYKSLIAGSGS